MNLLKCIVITVGTIATFALGATENPRLDALAPTERVLTPSWLSGRSFSPSRMKEWSFEEAWAELDVEAAFCARAVNTAFFKELRARVSNNPASPSNVCAMGCGVTLTDMVGSAEELSLLPKRVVSSLLSFLSLLAYQPETVNVARLAEEVEGYREAREEIKDDFERARRATTGTAAD